MFESAGQPERVYRQLAEQQRETAAKEALPNVRLLLEHSADKWEALADAAAPARNKHKDARGGSSDREPPFIIRTGNLIVNRAKKSVVAQGNPIRLTPKEFAVVELLAIHTDRHVTKQMLIDHIYPGRKIPDPKIIDVYLCKLRKKLFDGCGDGNLIHTCHGSGYQLRTESADAA